MKIHVDFNEAQTAAIDAYLKKRGKNKTHWVREALDLFTNVEPASESFVFLKTVLDRHFAKISNIPHSSLNSFLFMLSSKYPHENAKFFWGPVLLTHKDITNRELYVLVTEEIKQLAELKDDGAKGK